jgi:hypothetical protein
MLTAAFSYRSWLAPHCGHPHSRTDSERSCCNPVIKFHTNVQALEVGGEYETDEIERNIRESRGFSFVPYSLFIFLNCTLKRKAL